MQLEDNKYTKASHAVDVTNNVVTLKATPRILVVDDDRVNRMIWKEVLEANCNLFFAKDGIEALALYEQVHPSLIVLDRMMPNMHGDEVMAEIRKRDKTGTTKIVMHSMLESSEEQLDGMKKGADLYIPKSTDIDVAVTQIQSLLNFEKSNLTTGLFKIAREQNRKPGFAGQYVAENIYRHSKLMHEDIRVHRTDVTRVLSETIQAVTAKFPYGKIEFADKTDDTLIMGNSDYLNHAFYIVLKRSYDAIASQDKGQILVEMKNDENEIHISIEDNGPQIPYEEWRSIFHFECNKEKIQIGLPIAWETAQRHLGDLIVTEGEIGPRFLFRFPTLKKLAQLGELPAQ